MSNTLAFRLFGVGRIPDQLKVHLEQEGILLQDEGIAVSVTNGEGHTTAIRQPFTTSPVYLFL